MGSRALCRSWVGVVLLLFLLTELARAGEVPSSATTITPLTPLSKAEVEIGFLQDRAWNWPMEAMPQPNSQSACYRRQVLLAFRYTASTWRAYGSVVPASPDTRASTALCLLPRNWNAIRANNIGGWVQSIGIISNDQLQLPSFGWAQWVAGESLYPGILGNRAEEWAGWGGYPCYRPLLLSSSQYLEDLEDWHLISSGKQGSLPPNVMKSFRAMIERETKLLGFRYNYQDKDIVVQQCLKSAVTQDSLYEIEIGETAAGIASVVGVTDVSYWFGYPAGGSPVLIGKEMRLLDYGDFDGDNHTEFVFFVQREAEDGFLLTSKRFSNTSETTWKYH